MKKINYSIVGLLLMISLSACWPIGGKHGLIHNREEAYLQAKSEPDLKIPPDLSNYEIQSDYAIPKSTDTQPLTEPVLIAPPGSILNPLKK